MKLFNYLFGLIIVSNGNLTLLGSFAGTIFCVYSFIKLGQQQEPVDTLYLAFLIGLQLVLVILMIAVISLVAMMGNAMMNGLQERK